MTQPALQLATAEGGDREGSIQDPRLQGALRVQAGRRMARAARTGRVSGGEADRAVAAAFGERWWSAWDRAEAVEAGQVEALLAMGPTLRERMGGEPLRATGFVAAYALRYPTHTGRSLDGVAMQQFSTPLDVAWVMACLCGIGAGMRWLEPSAGNGGLAGAAVAQGADPRLGVLNERHPVRKAVLESLFPLGTIRGEDAGRLSSLFGGHRFERVLMNPPFSRTLQAEGRKLGTARRHAAEAGALLSAHGRLVVLGPASSRLTGAEWEEAKEAAGADEGLRLTCDVVLGGSLYRKRGTTFATRLSVLDRDGDAEAPEAAEATTIEALQAWARGVPAAAEAPIGIEEADEPRPTGRGRRQERRRPRRALDEGVAARGTTIESEEVLERRPGRGRTVERASAEVYTPWTATQIRYAHAVEHVSALVESRAMGSVEIPPTEVEVHLPASLVDTGALSDAQLESIALAVKAHSHTFAMRVEVDSNGARSEGGEGTEIVLQCRRGWMLGDGTGVGKGRQIAGIILESWRRGHRRSLWISQSSKLIHDARRDWSALGGDPRQVVELGRIPVGTDVGHREGILFLTYATLRQKARSAQARSRMEQILAWLAPEHRYEGVVVFDESHALGRAAGGEQRGRGTSRPSQQGLAGLAIQSALPLARVVYASATGATGIQGLAYAERLGLWGSDETPFADRPSFMAAMDRGGIAAQEIVARDLKALGRYQARLLAFHGVEIEPLVHHLDEVQHAMWDEWAGAFQVIHDNLEQALKACGVLDHEGRARDGRLKAQAESAFESAKQRFFSHMLSSMKTPTLIRAIEQVLEAGRSAVVQLTSTAEALTERRLREVPPEQYEDLHIDVTPHEYVLDYLHHAFPTTDYEEVEGKDGGTVLRPRRDEEGNVVESPRAIARREEMIRGLTGLPGLPGALDQLVWRFGPEEGIAEITGRSRRIERVVAADGSEYRALRRRAGDANVAEADAFMRGDVRVLVFSLAGGIGRSYHADRECGNRQRRVHFLLEPGWRADQAVQGLGRTHRANQTEPPICRPVTTDVKGELRFVSTISRRLDEMGAVTRGQRTAQSKMDGAREGLFAERDNLEAAHALAGLRDLYSAILVGEVEGFSEEQFTRETGLALRDGDGQPLRDQPPVGRFLNRLLAMRIERQNLLFGALEQRIEDRLQDAIDSGDYGRGVEELDADRIKVVDRKTISTDEETGARTELVELEIHRTLRVAGADEVLAWMGAPGTEVLQPALAINEASRNAAVIHETVPRYDAQGLRIRRSRIRRPGSGQNVDHRELVRSSWRETSDVKAWARRWDAQAEAARHQRQRRWLVQGLLLPLWDRLPGNDVRVRRLTTDEGESCIGRILEQGAVAAVDPSTLERIDAAEMFTHIRSGEVGLKLTNGWTVLGRVSEGRRRIMILGEDVHLNEAVWRSIGVQVHMVSWDRRHYVPGPRVLERLLARYGVREVLCYDTKGRGQTLH